MGLFDSVFGSQTKGEGFEKIPLSESQKIADAKRQEILQKKEVFQPREIAGLTKAEQMAVNEVTGMMSRGIPGVSEAMDAVRGFMNPDLSPKNIPGLSGLFQQVQELGSSLMGKTKRGLAMTGNIPSASSSGTKVLGRTFQDILDRFTTAAYPFYQQQLSNMYSAPERLASLGMGDVTTRTGMAMTTGAAPRTIQQQINDAIFEAKRKTQGFPYDVTFPMTSDVMGEERYGWNPGTTSPSIFSQIASGVGAVAPFLMSGGLSLGGGGVPAGGWDAHIQNKYGF